MNRLVGKADGTHVHVVGVIHQLGKHSFQWEAFDTYITITQEEYKAGKFDRYSYKPGRRPARTKVKGRSTTEASARKCIMDINPPSVHRYYPEPRMGMNPSDAKFLAMSMMAVAAGAARGIK